MEPREYCIHITMRQAVPTVEILRVPATMTTGEELSFMEKKIGCNFAELVRPARLPGYGMYVDEEGLLKPNPKINGLATFLYGYEEHGGVIAGDAIITGVNHTGETKWLTEMEANTFVNKQMIAYYAFCERMRSRKEENNV